MTVAEQTGTTWRWQRTLHGPDTLDDDLGTIGMWVGPRTGPLKRTQDEKNDYLLRRLLVAWKQAGVLRFPVEVHAEHQIKGEPDFVLSWKDGTLLGVEVTEAGTKEAQAWTTEGESAGVRHVPFDETVEATAVNLHIAISDKVEAFDKKKYYRVPGGCDLLVYSGVSGGYPGKRADILERLGRPEELSGRFRQVHVIFGREVWLDIFGDRRAVDVSQAYEVDFVAWLFAQAEHLRQGRFDRLDVRYLAEELESLGRSDKRALGSQISRLLLHLLKWQFQPEHRGRSWQASIDDARIKIERLLADSLSLESLLQSDEFLDEEYGRARKAAVRDTGVNADAIPEACPYTAEQLVDPEFMPE
jgi:hypothetical protein